MGARGRLAATELTVVGHNNIEAIRRPEPPDELNSEMAEEWRKIVNRMPGDWFPEETLPLLVQYCAHIIRARRLREALAEVEHGSDESFDIYKYKLLSVMETQQSRAIATLATKMRLSQQATYNAQKTKGPRSRPRHLWAGADDN